MSATSKVYQAIAAVTQQIGKQGIAKDRKNDQQGYKFRGIDDVFNSLSPLLSENNLCILPCVLERSVTERVNSRGNALFYVTVKVRFDFVSSEDGSRHEVVMYGEAMDSGDKATNKAMSAAYKYAAMQAFCIPTEGDNDADQQTHEVKATKIIPTDGAMDRVDTASRKRIEKLAIDISSAHAAGNEWGAFETYEGAGLDADEKVALWSLLGSKVRASLKALKAAETAAETA